jgi:peptide/nickel transport system substrate-binding protein
MSMTTVAMAGMLFCSQPPMKRLAWSLLALGVLAAFSCARREPAAPPPATLARHLSGDPATLDPTAITEEEALRVSAMMFRPLLGIDKDLRAVPALARSWSVSPDGLVYEFHLDPKATWETGSPVTSDDVRFTIERVHDPTVTAASWSWGFEDLAAIETPDPETVRVRFQRPYSERLLAFEDLPIVSGDAYKRAKPGDADRGPVGSGPYRLSSWEANRSIRLTRRPDAPAAAFSEIVFRVIPDGARYQAGSARRISTVPHQPRSEEDRRGLSRLSRALAIVKAPQFLEALVLWNCRTRSSPDPRVRQALAMAWPRATRRSGSIRPTAPRSFPGPYRRDCRKTLPTCPCPPRTGRGARRLLDGPAGSRARTA